MSSRDSLGDRMKGNYENRQRFYLIRRIPVIMRLDGKSFHTLTKRFCNRPFDGVFNESMIQGAMATLKIIEGAKCAYVASDEVTILITDFDKLTTEAWFDYNVSKMISISACSMSLAFSKSFEHDGLFDCRVHNIPVNEVANNFVFRQKDWIRNSIFMYAQSFFSHKQLHKKNQSDMHEMLHEIGKNWTTDLSSEWKNGTFIRKVNGVWEPTGDVIFTQNRSSVDDLMIPSEE